MRETGDLVVVLVAAAALEGIVLTQEDRELVAAEVQGIAGVLEALWSVPLPPALGGSRQVNRRV